MTEQTQCLSSNKWGDSIVREFWGVSSWLERVSKIFLIQVLCKHEGRKT